MHINNCWFLELDLLLKSQRNLWQHSGIGIFAAACTTPNRWKQLRVQFSPLEGFDFPNLSCMQIMVLVPVCDGQTFAQTRIYKISIPPLASILWFEHVFSNQGRFGHKRKFPVFSLLPQVTFVVETCGATLTISHLFSSAIHCHPIFQGPLDPANKYRGMTPSPLSHPVAK